MQLERHTRWPPPLLSSSSSTVDRRKCLQTDCVHCVPLIVKLNWKQLIIRPFTLIVVSFRCFKMIIYFAVCICYAESFALFSSPVSFWVCLLFSFDVIVEPYFTFFYFDKTAYLWWPVAPTRVDEYEFEERRLRFFAFLAKWFCFEIEPKRLLGKAESGSRDEAKKKMRCNLQSSFWMMSF